MHHSLLRGIWKKVPLHSRGGSTAHRLGVKIKTEREEKGSVSTRRGTLEAVFEQGQECSARGRISGGGERRTSAEQGTGGLEKQCGIKPSEMCWVGSGLARRGPERGLMRTFSAPFVLRGQYSPDPSSHNFLER